MKLMVSRLLIREIVTGKVGTAFIKNSIESLGTALGTALNQKQHQKQH